MRPRWLCGALLAGLLMLSPVRAQTCAQKAELISSAEVYRDLPRYVTGLGWQGVRTDSLPSNAVVWVCQDRAVDFGFASKTWSQIGYRAPGPDAPWRFGWILKAQWRPAPRNPSRPSRAEGGIQPATYPAKHISTNRAPAKTNLTEAQPAVPPDTAPKAAPDAPLDAAPDTPQNLPPATDNADTPPTLPANKSSSGALLDTQPESASLSEQIVLYGPLFLAMLLGMLAKALFDLLDDTKPSWREHLRHGAMAIVISPVVFLGFITAGQFNSSSQTFLVLALFAFQNGFFWQTVLKRNPPTSGKNA